MLSKVELQEHNKNFWEEFRKRMRKHHSSSGRRTNWLNYPSDVKSIFIRLEVTKKYASLNLDLQFKDKEIRELVWEQLFEMKKIMEIKMGFEAEWLEDMYLDNGQQFYRIQWKKAPCNYFEKSEQESIYDFLENVLLKFDEFYQEFKEIVINLVH